MQALSAMRARVTIWRVASALRPMTAPISSKSRSRS
jgi:hypothetical protein